MKFSSVLLRLFKDQQRFFRHNRAQWENKKISSEKKKIVSRKKSCINKIEWIGSSAKKKIVLKWFDIGKLQNKKEREKIEEVSELSRNKTPKWWSAFIYEQGINRQFKFFCFLIFRSLPRKKNFFLYWRSWKNFKCGKEWGKKFCLITIMKISRKMSISPFWWEWFSAEFLFFTQLRKNAKLPRR